MLWCGWEPLAKYLLSSTFTIKKKKKGEHLRLVRKSMGTGKYGMWCGFIEKNLVPIITISK